MWCIVDFEQQRHLSSFAIVRSIHHAICYMLFLRIPDTLSRLDLLDAVYLASTYPTYRTYVRIRRNCLDGKIIIPYMRANRTTRYEAKKLFQPNNTYFE